MESENTNAVKMVSVAFNLPEETMAAFDELSVEDQDEIKKDLAILIPIWINQHKTATETASGHFDNEIILSKP